jgi:hypothetical protein
MGRTSGSAHTGYRGNLRQICDEDLSYTTYGSLSNFETLYPLV